jgi:ribosome silencing factor RsfS/YbeB/iojap
MLPPPLPFAPHLEDRVIARKPTEPPQTGAKPPRKRAVARRKTQPVGLPMPGTLRKKAAVAGPRKAATRGAKRAEPSRLEQLQNVIITSLDDDKAESVVTLDLAGRAAFADRMIIATGLADRQIAAMATHLQEKLHEAGLKRVQVEGGAGADWVLIDAGDIVVHLFKPEARTLYGLERMWGAELDDEQETGEQAQAG